MHVTLNTVGRLGKSISIKREKQADDTEAVVVHLKITDIIITREELDELLCMPIGWSQQTLYGEQGEPYLQASITLHKFAATVTGRIKGAAGTDEGIALTQADWSGATVELKRNSALLSGTVSWLVAGDEAGDIEPLIGRDCMLHVVIQDAQQGDLLKAA